MAQAMASSPRGLTIKDRKRQVTRDAVLDAVVEVIGDRGFDFSVQDVADRAGIAHRTVYRHFPTREALVDAVAERFESGVAMNRLGEAETLQALLDELDVLYAWFDSEADLVHAVAVKTLATGKRTGPSQRRSEHWRGVLKAAYPNLAAEDLEPAFIIIRNLLGMVGWHLLTSEPGISSAQAAQAMRRMVEVALVDLERRDKEAANAAAGRKS
ncbi:MAG TPA: helix-turn-helix domain-containing protein [Acidimicrobiia bacterium]|nr:helix-turn-helix domain-containing protein [Acidimicrobiia bacterium]